MSVICLFTLHESESNIFNEMFILVRLTAIFELNINEVQRHMMGCSVSKICTSAHVREFVITTNKEKIW
jgi:hypothetical protein